MNAKSMIEDLFSSGGEGFDLTTSPAANAGDPLSKRKQIDTITVSNDFYEDGFDEEVISTENLHIDDFSSMESLLDEKLLEFTHEVEDLTMNELFLQLTKGSKNG